VRALKLVAVAAAVAMLAACSSTRASPATPSVGAPSPSPTPVTSSTAETATLAPTAVAASSAVGSPPAASVSDPTLVTLPRSSAPPVAALTVAEAVDNCEHAHNMAQATPPPSDAYKNVVRFVSCSWPPPTWADPDGFVVLTATLHDGPGTSEASDANVADDISGPCKQYRISYVFEAQGAQSALPPFTAKAGVVTGVDEAPKPWPGGVSTLDFYPKVGDIVVLRNNNDVLVGASCVS
jgi:hypothetical protein